MALPLRRMGWDGRPPHRRHCHRHRQPGHSGRHPFSPRFGFGWKITHPSPLHPSLPRFFPIQSNSNRLISPLHVRRRRRKPLRAKTYPRRAAQRRRNISIYLARSRTAHPLAPFRSLGKKVSGHPVCSFLGILGPSFPNDNDQPTDRERPTIFWSAVVFFYAHSSSKREKSEQWLQCRGRRVPLLLFYV